MTRMPTGNIAQQIAGWIVAACTDEVTACKPGNVHPLAPFDDLMADDFIRAGQLAAPSLARAGELGIGAAVLQSVIAVRSELETNVNLGIALLLAPLAAAVSQCAARECPIVNPLFECSSEDETGVHAPLEATQSDRRHALHREVRAVLAAATVDDSNRVFEAIRVAQPGGLGSAGQEDVSSAATKPLQAVMALAAERDTIAWLYANRFDWLFASAWPVWRKWQERVARLSERPPVWTARNMAIVGLALELQADRPDTLIARKRGLQLAANASARARTLLNSGWPESPGSWRDMEEFDRWLRSDGHALNPGTTADVVAAVLFLDYWIGQSVATAG